jgi:hypothetical protein
MFPKITTSLKNDSVSFGTNTTWKAMFERRGMPKVILIEAEDVLEFVSNL